MFDNIDKRLTRPVKNSKGAIIPSDAAILGNKYIFQKR